MPFTVVVTNSTLLGIFNKMFPSPIVPNRRIFAQLPSRCVVGPQISARVRNIARGAGVGVSCGTHERGGS